MSDRKAPDLSALLRAGYSEETALARVNSVIDQWGESFARAAENPRFTFHGETIETTLWKPIELAADGKVGTLTMRELSLDEMTKLDKVKGDVAQVKTLIVTACAITDREAGQIGLRDLALLTMLVEGFSGAVPSTGERR